MAVSQELLDILVCPLDKTPVKLTSDQHGLKCPSCRRVYPIREDIPVMLVDEARISAPKPDSGRGNTDHTPPFTGRSCP
jgi:hypothetical protein